MQISELVERKFIETINLSDWEVETDTSYVDIESIGKTIEYDEYVLKTKNGLQLICADTHIVFDEFGGEVYVKDLYQGQIIKTKNGLDQVLSVTKNGNKSNMYDLKLSNNSNHRFYTNDILSHNSMWLHNIASNAANSGFNVAIITLEMSSNKVMKRLAAIRLNINPKDYDEFSKDTIFMKNKINELKNATGKNDLFDKSPGKIFVKKFNTSDCTISDIDVYIKKLQESKHIKLDMVVLDYINLMSIEKGLEFSGAMLYLKGKHLAEGLRYLGDKYNVAVITATQTDKSVWSSSDIKLENIPESKAVAETCDVCWAIIRNSEMKKNNNYILKILKLRDGEHKEDRIKFDFNTNNLRIENDNYIGTK